MHSPFGAQVHAPWALAIAARLRERYGIDVQAMHADDGIVLRLPDLEVADVPGGSLDIADLVLMEPDTVEDLVTGEVGGSALFAARSLDSILGTSHFSLKTLNYPEVWNYHDKFTVLTKFHCNQIFVDDTEASLCCMLRKFFRPQYIFQPPVPLCKCTLESSSISLPFQIVPFPLHHKIL